MAEKNDYVNRELSWIEFNYRVLSEARDKSTPLFDRLKFLSITASNLDEFYMVRVASLKDMVHAKYAKKDIAGLTAKEQLDKISEKTHQLVDLQYSTYNRSLVPALSRMVCASSWNMKTLPKMRLLLQMNISTKMYIRSLHQWPLTHPDHFL